METNKLFKQIYYEYYQKLVFYAVKYVIEKQDAEDIVENVFTKLWILEDKLVVMENIKSYLYRAVHNRCIDFIRANKRALLLKKDFIEDATTEEDVTYRIVKAELLTEVLREINKLPLCHQLICNLYFSEGLNTKEIAAKLHLSIKTIRNARAISVNRIRNTLNP